MDWLIDWCINGWMVRGIDWSIDQCIDWWIDWLIDQWIDRLNELWMDGWINGPIHWWVDWLNEQKTRREGIQGTPNKKKEIGVGVVWGEWRKMRVKAVKEHYSQISCSCVIYLVHGAQSKCKRKCWFVFYAFLWTCQETAKSQAFEIVYPPNAGVLKGW